MLVDKTNSDIIIHALRNNKVVLIDDALPLEEYEVLERQVVRAWSQSNSKDMSWKLFAKASAEPATRVKLKDIPNMERIHSAFLKSMKTKFGYWYYALSPSQGAARALIEQIKVSLVEAQLSSILDALEINDDRHQFSITAFDEKSFIDKHNDHSGSSSAPYKLTILLYFSDFSSDIGGQLVFFSNNKKQEISPKRNRLVMFTPGVETIHKVSMPVAGCGSVRLAFSGWFVGEA